MKIRSLFLTIISIIVLYNIGFGQQEPQFTQNMFNTMNVNPGFAGHGDAICITLLHREQWMGFKQEIGEGEGKEKVRVSPVTSSISGTMPIKMLHGGIGANIMQDNIGFEKNISFELAYAYQRSVGYGKLGIGLQIGFLNKIINFTQFEAIDEDDPLLQGGGNEENTMYMDFALGTYYSNDNLYLGLSASQLTQSSSDIGPASPELKRHYYLTSGYTINLPNAPQFDITPSIFIKTDIAATQYDLNTILKYKNKVWGGLTYRVTEGIALMGGLKFDRYKIGAAYDIPTSAISHSGSLELVFNYCFKIETEKTPEIYRNVRFL